jgi:hypothetical protein
LFFFIEFGRGYIIGKGLRIIYAEEGRENLFNGKVFGF